MPRSMLVTGAPEGVGARGAVGRVDGVLEDGGELGGPEGQPADLRVALDVDEVLGAQQQSDSWPRFISGQTTRS